MRIHCDLVDFTGRKRPRTILTPKQLDVLKAAFASNPKPSKLKQGQLSKKTGLDTKVIRVWFRNRRAKERQTNGKTQSDSHSSASPSSETRNQSADTSPATPDGEVDTDSSDD